MERVSPTPTEQDRRPRKGRRPDNGIHEVQTGSAGVSTHPTEVAPPSLAARKCMVMSEVNRLKKTGVNSHHGYKFATESDVADLLRELLAKYGIGLQVSMSEVGPPEQVGKQTRWQVGFEFTLINADDPEDKEWSTWIAHGIDSQDKALNKAATTALKFFLLKTFLVSTGEDGQTPAVQQSERDADFGDADLATSVQLRALRDLCAQQGVAWEKLAERIKADTGEEIDTMRAATAAAYVEKFRIAGKDDSARVAARLSR